MPFIRALRAAATVAILAVALPLSAAAATPDPLQVVAGHLADQAVYVAPGYDGPTLDVAKLTDDIGAGTAPIKVVLLPTSIASHYPAADIPGLIRRDAKYTGDVAVVTKTAFYATDPAAANNARSSQLPNGPTAVVDAYIKNVQRTHGGPIAGQRSHASIITVVVVLVVVAALILLLASRSRRRRRIAATGQEGLESMRRRVQASLSVLQAEYTDHDGTDATVQGTIDAAGGLISSATTAEDLRAAQQLIDDGRNQLHPGRVPARRELEAAGQVGGPDGTGAGYAVNRQGRVQQYSGAVPYGYQVLPPQYYGSVSGGSLTDLFILSQLFGGGFGGGYGGYDQGFDQGFADGVSADNRGDGGGQDPNAAGGGSWDDSSSNDTGGGDWGGGGGGGDFGGGGGGDFGGGGGDSGGGSW